MRSHQKPIEEIMREIGINPLGDYKEPEKKPKGPNLEKIASTAFQNLTKEVVRAFSEAKNKLDLARQYISQFTIGLKLTEEQMGAILQSFSKYVKDKISLIKSKRSLTEQMEDYFSKGDLNRKEREKSASEYVLSKIANEDIITKNPLEWIYRSAEDFYEEKGHTKKPYEIREVMRRVEKRVVLADERIISVDSQLREMNSLNDHSERKDRIHRVYNLMKRYLHSKKEIASENPLETLKHIASRTYKVLGFQEYRNEINTIVNSAWNRVRFDSELGRIISLEDRLRYSLA